MAMRSGEERIGQPTWTNMFRINLTATHGRGGGLSTGKTLGG